MKYNSDVKIREPIVDGFYYPESAEELRENIRTLSDASPEPPGKAAGICVPHAAYEKVGDLLASAFLSAAKFRFRRLVLLGPVHREFVDQVILPESTIFRSPLGDCAVDEEALETLMSCGTIFVRNDIPHLEEHCLEVLLPFVSYHFPDAQIVPLLLGRDSRSTVTALTKALYVTFGSDFSQTLFVVSTNFSGGGDMAMGRAEADRIIDLALRGDAQGLLSGKIAREFSACGVGSLAVLLGLRPGGKLRLLGRASTISDLEKRRGVEYAALSLEA